MPLALDGRGTWDLVSSPGVQRQLLPQQQRAETSAMEADSAPIYHDSTATDRDSRSRLLAVPDPTVEALAAHPTTLRNLSQVDKHLDATSPMTVAVAAAVVAAVVVVAAVAAVVVVVAAAAAVVAVVAAVAVAAVAVAAEMRTPEVRVY